MNSKLKNDDMAQGKTNHEESCDIRAEQKLSLLA